VFALVPDKVTLDTREPLPLVVKAAEIFRRLSDKERLFDALTNGARQFNYAGGFASAERALAEASSLIDPQWPLWMRAMFELVASGVLHWRVESSQSRITMASSCLKPNKNVQ
jgi:hypothetical protein